MSGCCVSPARISDRGAFRNAILRAPASLPAPTAEASPWQSRGTRLALDVVTVEIVNIARVDVSEAAFVGEQPLSW